MHYMKTAVNSLHFKLHRSYQSLILNRLFWVLTFKFLELKRIPKYF